MKAPCLILAGTFVCHAIADGGYAKNCQNMTLIDLDDPHVGLRASCKIENKAQCSILDLGQCYGNDDGVLKPQDGGGLRKCRSCHLVNGTVLQCRCRAHFKDRYYTTSVDTNDLVVNSNGVLKCFGTSASMPDDCAQKPLNSGSGHDLSLIILGYALSLCGIAFFWS